jgi:hypothetical protein
MATDFFDLVSLTSAVPAAIPVRRDLLYAVFSLHLFM